MNDPVQDPTTPTPPAVPPRRRFFRRAAVATLIAGVADRHRCQGVRPRAGFGGWHRGGFMGRLDPAEVDEHLDRMLKHLYVEIDATDAQKQQLAPIVKAAARDLLPLRTQMHDARRQAVELLSRDQHRSGGARDAAREPARLADRRRSASPRRSPTSADVLTPEQRKELAERIGRWHGRRG